jgi:hypothetical protein
MRPNQGTGRPEDADLFASALISSYVDDVRFVPRPWLVGRVGEALARPDVRFVLVTGEPGSGKTALLAHLARQHQDAPRYFIRRDSVTALEGGDARALLFSVGHQLAALHPSLFDPRKLEVVVRQRAERIASGGSMVAIQAGDLQASPFLATALKVTQSGGVVEGELVGISAARVTLEPRLLDLSNLQYLALLDPAQALSDQDPAARIVVLVDALDEIRYGPRGEDVLSWLATCPELPANLRFVLTSRPDPDLLRSFRHAKASELVELSIDPKKEEQRDRIREDLQRYLAGVADEPHVARALTVQDVQPAAFVEAAAGKAQGNFQYAVALARGIDQALAHEPPGDDLPALLRLQGIPSGTGDLYRFFLTRVKEAADRTPVQVAAGPLAEPEDRPAWPALYHPVLAVLAVAFEPLSSDQLQSYAAVPPGSLPRALEHLAQFLDPLPDQRYRLYHASLPEFLTGKATDAPADPFHVDPGVWHGRVAGRLLRANPDWLACTDRYALGHTPAHLTEAIRLQTHEEGSEPLASALTSTLTDLRFLERRMAEVGGVDLVLGDLQTALATMTSEPSAGQQPADVGGAVDRTTRTTLGGLAAVIERGAHRLRRVGGAVAQGGVAFEIALRAMELGQDQLATAARRRLEQLPASHLVPEWVRTDVPLTPLYELPRHRIRRAGIDETESGLLVAFWDSEGSFAVWWPETGAVHTIPQLRNEVSIRPQQPEMAATVFLRTGQILQTKDRGTAAFVEHRATVYAAEWDPLGQIWVRPLGSAALWREVGDPATGGHLEPTEEQKRTSPVARLRDQVDELQFVTGREREPRLAVVTRSGRLLILRPFEGNEARPIPTSISDAATSSTSTLSSTECGTMVLLAVLTDSRPVVLVDAATGDELDALPWSALPPRTRDLIEKVEFVEEDVDEWRQARLVLQLRNGDVLLWDRQQVHRAALPPVSLLRCGRRRNRPLLLADSLEGLRVWDLATVFTPRDEARGPIGLLATVDTGPEQSIAWVSSAQASPVLTVGTITGSVCEVTFEAAITRQPELLAIGRLDGETCVVVCETFNTLYEIYRPRQGLTRTAVQDHESWPPELAGFDLAALAIRRDAENQLRVPTFLAHSVGESAPSEFRPRRIISDGALSCFAAFDLQGHAVVWERGAGQQQHIPAGSWRSAQGLTLEAVGSLEHELYLAVVQTVPGQTLLLHCRHPLPQPTHLPGITGSQGGLPAFGRHGDQLLLAIGATSELTLHPVTDGPISGRIEVSLVPTSLFFAPGRLLVGTPEGIVSLAIK